MSFLCAESFPSIVYTSCAWTATPKNYRRGSRCAKHKVTDSETLEWRYEGRIQGSTTNGRFATHEQDAESFSAGTEWRSKTTHIRIKRRPVSRWIPASLDERKTATEKRGGITAKSNICRSSSSAGAIEEANAESTGKRSISRDSKKRSVYGTPSAESFNS